MPTNKNAAFRYRVLNGCFTNRGRRRWMLEELVREVSRQLHDEFGQDTTVSKRTIQGDLNVMRSPRPRGFGAPIACKRGYYFYEDPNFSTEVVPLSNDELGTLREAFDLLRQFRWLPQMEGLEAVLRKIEGREKLENLSPHTIQFETNNHVRGLEWLPVLYGAIELRQTVRLHYQPFGEPQALAFDLHPYLLKEWRNRWYVFGRTEEGELWNPALDRILKIEHAQTPYVPNDLFNPDSWFDDIIGVTKPPGMEPVELEIHLRTMESFYLETKPLHASQVLVHRDAERAVFRLRVIPNTELVRELLRLGGDLLAIAPDSVRRMVEERRG